MQNSSRSSAQKRPPPWLVAVSSYIGTTIEWYDFFLYGTAAAVVFNVLFFPAADPALATIVSFGSLGVAYIARPLGGIVIAHFGDRIGRKKMLVLTVMVMGSATVLVGLLPTYSVVGGLAPILLLICRLFQGIGIGGEYGGAVLLTVEHAPRNRRGIYGSLTQLGVASGLLLAAGIFAVVSASMSPEQFLLWGWRLPFIFSVVLLFVGVFLRLKISESPAFEETRDQGEQERIPLFSLVHKQRRATVLTIGQRLAEACVFNLYAVYMLSYITNHLEVQQGTGVAGTLIAAALMHVSTVAFGAASDRFGRKAVYVAGALVSGMLVIPVFLLVGTRDTALIWLGIALALGVGWSAMYGPLAAWWTEQFRVNVRYSGVSMAYQLGGAIGGGFTPLIAATLLYISGGHFWWIAAFVGGVCSLSAVSGLLANETVRRDAEEQVTGGPSVSTAADDRSVVRGVR